MGKGVGVGAQRGEQLKLERDATLLPTTQGARVRAGAKVPRALHGAAAQVLWVLVFSQADVRGFFSGGGSRGEPPVGDAEAESEGLGLGLGPGQGLLCLGMCWQVRTLIPFLFRCWARVSSIETGSVVVIAGDVCLCSNVFTTESSDVPSELATLSKSISTSVTCISFGAAIPLPLPLPFWLWLWLSSVASSAAITSALRSAACWLTHRPVNLLARVTSWSSGSVARPM